MPPKRKVTNDGESAKKKSKDEEKERKNSIVSDLNEADFHCEAKSSEDKLWNLKITSWNVNGIRALLGKNGFDFLRFEKPDIFCVQETKCPKEKLPVESKLDGYEAYWLSGDTDGYSGVGLYSKIKPLKITYGIGNQEHDNEGRVITAEYDKFFLVATYVPNAGRKLVRLEYRQKWDKDFRDYLLKLEEQKPVILTGDLNVAHKEIDLANPKTNTKTAGFTKEERDGFTNLLESGFIDSFRHLYPDRKKAYTYWTYLSNARAKDVGWRLDYFVLSKKLIPNLCDNVIRKQVMGSDHCPISLHLAI